MRRGGVGALVFALAALAVLVAPAPPAATQQSPSLTLTISPDTVRQGRPVTLTARVHDAPPDFLPAFVRFLDPWSKEFRHDVPLGADFTARLVVRPQFDGYKAYVFSDNPSYGPIFGSTVPVSVITGFRVDLTFSTIPATAGPGDDVVVRVVAGYGGEVHEGGAPPPTGLVSVRSAGSTLGSRMLNAGRADIPVTLPANGAPFTVAYEGDDLYVGSASSPFRPPRPPSPPLVPPASQSGGVTVVSPSTEPVATGATSPTVTTAPLRQVDDEADEEDPPDTATEVDDADDDVEDAAAPAPGADGDGEDGGPDRSSFVLGIPAPVSVDWGGAHLAVNLLLALLLMILTGIPALLVDATIEENYHRIVRSFAADEERAIHRIERRLQDLPDPVLLVGLSLTTAVAFSFLDPSAGLDVTTAVLVAALALAVALLIAVHDLARLPYLNRRFGRPAAVFGVYPFSLVLAAVLVVVSRVAGFEPGYVFGIVGSLAVKETVTDRDEAATLAAVGGAFLGIALLSWWLWHPIVDEVATGDPSGVLVFADALLAGLWLTALQGVAFGFAPMRFLDGGAVRSWNGRVWLLLWGAGMFLLVQFYLHPSAGRWGALDSTAMRSALSVWGVFLLGALLFWAWFRFRPDPDNPDEDAGEDDEATIDLRDGAAVSP